MKALIDIQRELHAPKELRNNFGGYAYRNAEGILSAAKPILAKYGCYLVMEDTVMTVGDRYFVRADVTLKDKEGGEENASAYAELPLERKGMDAAQVTGASSSYARKYALCGLFAIDDSSLDPDATNTEKKEDKPAPRTQKGGRRPAAQPVSERVAEKKTMTPQQYAAAVEKAAKGETIVMGGQTMDVLTFVAGKYGFDEAAKVSFLRAVEDAKVKANI